MTWVDHATDRVGQLDCADIWYTHFTRIDNDSQVAPHASTAAAYISKTCKILDHTLGYLNALERLFKYHQVCLIVIGKIC